MPSRTTVVPPTKFQKLMVGEVSLSIFSAVCYSLHDHGLSLVPPTLSNFVGDEYSAVIVVVYLLFQTVATAVVLGILMMELRDAHYEELLLLRGVVEMQLLISTHFHFPIAFGAMLRELVGLFIAVTTLVICGRDARVFFSCDLTLKWKAMVVALFALAAFHVATVGIYDILLSSSHMHKQGIGLMTVAVSCVVCGSGAALAI